MAKARGHKIEKLLVALELAEAARYKPETLRDYLSKNMLARVVLEGRRSCRIGDVTGLTVGELERALSQRAKRFAYDHLGGSPLVSSLPRAAQARRRLVGRVHRPEHQR